MSIHIYVCLSFFAICCSLFTSLITILAGVLLWFQRSAVSSVHLLWWAVLKKVYNTTRHVWTGTFLTGTALYKHKWVVCISPKYETHDPICIQMHGLWYYSGTVLVLSDRYDSIWYDLMQSDSVLKICRIVDNCIHVALLTFKYTYYIKDQGIWSVLLLFLFYRKNMEVTCIILELAKHSESADLRQGRERVL